MAGLPDVTDTNFQAEVIAGIGGNNPPSSSPGKNPHPIPAGQWQVRKCCRPFQDFFGCGSPQDPRLAKRRLI